MEIFMIDGLKYVAIYTREINYEIIHDFIGVCNKVFGSNMNYKSFERKYIDNLYGDSIIVIVYKDSEPIAARGFWRNDIKDQKSYQPADTCVLKEYRSKGIFKNMTKLALSKTDKSDVIYNFPNINSYLPYKKLGWKDIAQYYPAPYFFFNKYKKECPYIIDNGYIKWWIAPLVKKGFKYKKIKNSYLLVKEIKKKRIVLYKVIGEINKEMIIYFEEAKKKRLAIYYSKRKNFYSRFTSPLRVIGLDSYDFFIPLYKMDAI